MKSSIILSYIFLILYLCIGFIPNWSAVDKIAPQWLGMNILNIIVVFHFLFNRDLLNNVISKFLNSKLTKIYGIFIIWAAGSFFYAINQTEQIVNISRQFNVFLMYGNMFVLISNLKNKIKFLSWLLFSILSVEIYFVMDQAIEMIKSNGFISPGNLKGLTANRNILAFSLAIKTPFIFFLLYFQKKIFQKIGLIILMFTVFLGLSMIQSRASFLATGFGIITFIIGVFYFRRYIEKKNFKKVIITSLGIIIPLVLVITINQTYFKDKGADVFSRAASIGAINTDDSITARLRYYSDVLNQFVSSPIFGVGLGNWKLKSIDFDKYDINGYVVPYHAHSDFIQLAAELGIIGFLSYLGIFLTAIIFGYKLILKNTDKSVELRLFIFSILISLGIYSVDASLNFPIARPQVLIVWTLILALLNFIFYEEKKIKPFKFISSSYLWICFFLLFPSLYVSNSVYKSLKGQMFLLQDFNSNQYNVPLNQVDTIVPDIPNITVTTIPINSVKARYYVNAKQYEKALALIEKGVSANPYLFYSELLKSQVYQAKGQLDSAKVYAKKAFFGLPNNALHASHYINLINQTRDREALEQAFDLLTFKNDPTNWKNYLIIGAGLYPQKDPLLIERAKKASELFPADQDIQGLYRQIVVGIQGLNQASQFSAAGLDYFNKGDHVNAALEFEKAIEANPLDYAHYENAATSNYLNGNLEKAVEQIDVVINEMNPLNGKCEYIKALIFIRMGDPIGACPLLETARDSGFAQAEGTIAQYCQF